MHNLEKIIPNRKKALFLAKRELPVLVCDAINLEGINYTLPEVQTLLDGVTVGGHKISDESITLNQAKAWGYLFNNLKNDQFELSKEFCCKLHAIAAYEESLEWGCFRRSGVTIVGTSYNPPEAKLLDELWNKMVAEAIAITDIYDKAIYIFLQMSRNQFFYDVNKRMGRFMMNGILLSQGYPIINLPAKRQLEFNQLMLAFYNTADVVAMTVFMKSCLDQRTVAIMSEI